MIFHYHFAERIKKEEGSDHIMKSIVLYSSHTGRTKKIAEHVVGGLPEGTPCLPVEEMPADINSYDCVFLGCWADGDAVDAGAVQALEHLNNKNVAVFVTVQSGPFSDDSAKILRTVIDVLPSGCKIVGTYVTPTEREDNKEESDQKARAFARDFAENTLDRLMGAGV